MNNGVMTMRSLDKGLAIEPGKTVKLAPGGYHVYEELWPERFNQQQG